jgi:hypothetical protein
MTIVESRLDSGTLTLGPVGTGQVDMSCQITNVVITSNYDNDGDPVTTLCGDAKPAGRKLTNRTLDGTFIQDFDDPDGIVAYLWDNDLTVVSYSYTPNDSGLVVTGSVMLEVPQSTYGGDVKTRLTSDFSWNMQDEPTRTYGTTPLGEATTEAAPEKQLATTSA